MTTPTPTPTDREAATRASARRSCLGCGEPVRARSVTGRCPACAWKALRGERRPVVLPEPESDWRPVLGLLLVLLAIVSVLAVLRRQVADNDARAWSSLPQPPAGEEPSEP